MSRWSRFRRRMGLARHVGTRAYALAYRATEVAEHDCDLEYGIKTDELLRRRFKMWLAVHILTSIVFYGLLALHIWAALYFGLRWLV